MKVTNKKNKINYTEFQMLDSGQAFWILDIGVCIKINTRTAVQLTNGCQRGISDSVPVQIILDAEFSGTFGE